jgi:hypothetical protein
MRFSEFKVRIKDQVARWIQVSEGYQMWISGPSLRYLSSDSGSRIR